jgi:autoinducer 2 (AI-2) kinase
VRVPEVREATALGCAIAAGTGAGLYGDMAATGEKLVSWHREFTPNPAHRELYHEMMRNGSRCTPISSVWWTAG